MAKGGFGPTDHWVGLGRWLGSSAKSALVARVSSGQVSLSISLLLTVALMKQQGVPRRRIHLVVAIIAKTAGKERKARAVLKSVAILAQMATRTPKWIVCDTSQCASAVLIKDSPKEKLELVDLGSLHTSRLGSRVQRIPSGLFALIDTVQANCSDHAA